MSELKYLASKNGLKYKIVRFEAGPEGKRAKINQKAATVDFTVYPARFEPILELTKEELEEISAFTRTMETELESIPNTPGRYVRSYAKYSTPTEKRTIVQALSRILLSTKHPTCNTICL